MIWQHTFLLRISAFAMIAILAVHTMFPELDAETWDHIFDIYSRVDENYEANRLYRAEKQVSASEKAGRRKDAVDKELLAILSLSFCVKEESIKECMHGYVRIPRNIRQAFQEDGWRFWITASDMRGSKGENVLGLCDPFYKVIEVEDRAGYQTVTHEYGHYVDCWYYAHHGQCFSNSHEWKSVLDLLGSNHLAIHDSYTFYNTYSDAECFAEAFRLYVCERESAQRKYPELMRVMEKAVRGVSDRMQSPQRREVAIAIQPETNKRKTLRRES